VSLSSALAPPSPSSYGKAETTAAAAALKAETTMSDTLERVRKIVIDHLDADPEKVVEKASFIDDLGADSLDNVELVMAFEEEFDVEIPDDAAEHIQTVGDAVKFIDEKLAG
jgi:acyl carrier protein